MGWIECEIFQRDLSQSILEQLVLLLYDLFIKKHEHVIKSWHFFREPTLRFRLLVKEDAHNTVREELRSNLDTNNEFTRLIERWYFSRHGKAGGEEYTGEEERYGLAWEQHYRLWEAGAELAIQIFRHKLDRAFHFVRARHLIYNQISPSMHEV